MKIFQTKRSFRKEFRRQIRLAITAAIGFSVAFAWRNAIYDSTLEIVKKFTESTQVISNEIITAILITIVSVLFLFITAKILK